MRRIVAFVLFAVLSFAASAAAPRPEHAIAMHGEAKYPAGFDHFDYVNPATYNFATSTTPNIGIAQGTAKLVTGVAAPLSTITAFLNSVDPHSGLTIAQTVAQGVVSGTFAAAQPTLHQCLPFPV